jgi:hypothetical protein
MAPLSTESRRGKVGIRKPPEFVAASLHLPNMQDGIRLKPRLLFWNALTFEGTVNSHPEELY